MIRDRNAVIAWWHALQPDPATGRSGDRATLAKLRRCATVSEVMLEPAAMDLFRKCKPDDSRDLPAVALAAGVLSHVRATEPGHPARHVGPESPDHPETALLKPLRFRVLMEARTPDERLTSLRRLVALAGQTLNVGYLASALLDWNEDRQREWVLAYWNADPRHAAASPAPQIAKDTVA